MTQRVIPTELLSFHGSLMLLLASAGVCRITRDGWICNIVFVCLSLVWYWVSLAYLRRSGRLLAWWNTQVLDRTKARFSAGVIIQFFDTLHLLIFFLVILLMIANTVYALETADGVSWSAACSASFAAASIGGSSFEANRTATTLCLAIAALIGLVVTALWVTIFMRAFDAVFKLHEKVDT